jgi:hypothetical protein
MTPEQAINTLDVLARSRMEACGEEDHAAAWMLAIRQCIAGLAANAELKRDSARLDFVLPMLHMTRTDIDFELKAHT